MPNDDLLDVLAKLAEVLQTQTTLGGVLANLAEVATSTVPGCDAASVAISVNGRPTTAAATALVALELDMVQYDLHDGPCLTAYRTLKNLRIDFVETDSEPTHFAIAARKLGINAVLSTPAIWGEEVVGTLNLYSRSGPFDDTAVTIAAVLAAQVTVAISRSPEYAGARDVVEQAQRDSDDKADVNVATGILMNNQGCTVEQAAGLLDQAATDGGQSIVQIAQRIILQHGNEM